MCSTNTYGEPPRRKQCNQEKCLRELRAQWERERGTSMQIIMYLQLRFAPGRKRQNAKKTMKGRFNLDWSAWG